MFCVAENKQTKNKTKEKQMADIILFLNHQIPVGVLKSPIWVELYRFFFLSSIR